MRFLIFIFILTGCDWFEKKSNESLDPLDEAHGTIENYETLVADPYDLWDRCDGLTWGGAWNTGVTREYSRIDVDMHEWSIIDEVKIRHTGQINRDRKPCFPDDSRSGVSPEIVMGWMHAKLTEHDCDAVTRAWEYGQTNNWIMGEGPEEYTSMLFLAPLMLDLKREVCSQDLAAKESDSWPELWEKFKNGYRGNVVAYYVSLYGRIHGFIRPWHLEAIELLKEENPDSPIYLALVARYSDAEGVAGVTGPALQAFQKSCPKGQVPDPGAEAFHWGDCCTACLCAYTLSIMEGR